MSILLNSQVSFEDKADPAKSDTEIVGILKNGTSNVTPITPSTNGNERDNKHDTEDYKPLVNGKVNGVKG